MTAIARFGIRIARGEELMEDEGELSARNLAALLNMRMGGYLY